MNCIGGIVDYVDVERTLHDKTRETSSEMQRQLQGIDVGGDRVALEQAHRRLGAGV